MRINESAATNIPIAQTHSNTRVVHFMTCQQHSSKITPAHSIGRNTSMYCFCMIQWRILCHPMQCPMPLVWILTPSIQMQPPKTCRAAPLNATAPQVGPLSSPHPAATCRRQHGSTAVVGGVQGCTPASCRFARQTAALRCPGWPSQSLQSSRHEGPTTQGAASRTTAKAARRCPPQSRLAAPCPWSDVCW